MIRRILLLPFFLLLFLPGFQQADAQILKTRLDVVGGLGYIEYAHVGLRYQYGECSQVGLYYGGDMGFKPEIITNWTLEHMYHFGKNNYFSNRPVWYTRQSLNYTRIIDFGTLYKIAYLQLSMGYDFPLNNRLGINFDMGLNCKMREKSEVMDADGSVHIDPRWDVLVLARLQLYVSL
jgi:hypothetical protein